MSMQSKCEECPMNKQCIYIQDTDECFAKIQSYQKAIDDFVEVVEISIIDIFVSDNKHDMAVGVLKSIAEQMKGV